MSSVSLLLAAAAMTVSAAVAPAFGGEERSCSALRVFPRPRQLSVDASRTMPFGPSTEVLVECRAAESVDWINRRFSNWYGAEAPRAKPGSPGLRIPAGSGAYAMVVRGGKVGIAAADAEGVRNAAQTLRQLVIYRRGRFRTTEREVSEFEVEDAPLLAFRGMHLCWFRSTTPAEIEERILMAALLKFNYVVLESWGVYRSRRHPWWGYPDGSMTPEALSRLVKIARELGIGLIPQINTFGHASNERRRNLGHAVLDHSPEYSSLFEPGGWNWCISNPETMRVICELIDEMYEAYGSPGYFHLGFDEAHDPICPECARPGYPERLSAYLGRLVAHVKGLGAKPMIWHDMLLDRYDARWRGFKAHGSADTARVLELGLDPELIVCDWEYLDGGGSKPTDLVEHWPTMEHLAAKGARLMSVSWKNYPSMPSQVARMRELGGLGHMGTSWAASVDDLSDIWLNTCAAAWGSPMPKAPWNDPNFLRYRQLIAEEMKNFHP